MIKVSMEEEQRARKIRLIAIITSLVFSLIILGIKFYAAKISDSAALRSDALEGSVNVLAAVFGLGAVLFAEKPADKEHPYGHGKIEYFSAVFEGGLITLAGFLILIDSVNRFINTSELHQLSTGLLLSVFAGFLNGAVGIGLYSVGKKYKSEVLVADGLHLLTDLATTIILGLGLAVILFTGWTILDPLLAFAVALFLFKTGYSIISSSANALLDAENPETLKEIVDQLNTIDRGSIITVHELKAQQFGRERHIDLHLVVPEYISIKVAHELCDGFAIRLAKQLGENCMIHTHIDPCNKYYCSICSIDDCPIRKKPFEKKSLITLDEATQKDFN